MAKRTERLSIRITPPERKQLLTIAEQLTEETGVPCGLTDAVKHAICVASTRSPVPAGKARSSTNPFFEREEEAEDRKATAAA